MSARATSPRSSLDWARACRTGQRKADRTRLRQVPSDPTPTSENRTNGIERDHGFLKERLRPMRGLKSVPSAAIFMRGHALMRNIRPWFLPDRGVRPAAAGLRLGLESTRRSGVIRQPILPA